MMKLFRKLCICSAVALVALVPLAGCISYHGEGEEWEEHEHFERGEGERERGEFRERRSIMTVPLVAPAGVSEAPAPPEPDFEG